MNTEKFKVQTKTIINYDKVFENESTIMLNNLKDYFKYFYNSDTFENIVYNSDLFETPAIDGVKIFTLDFYDNIVKVLSTYSTLGSHNSIISIWKGILGEDTIVEFVYRDDDNVYTDEINISANADVTGNITDSQDNPLITTNEAFIQWVANRTGLQVNELEQVFNYFIPAGIYIKCNFVSNNNLQTRRKLLNNANITALSDENKVVKRNYKKRNKNIGIL